MISSGVKKAIKLGLEAAIPDVTMSVSVWAEKFRVVDRGARKGKWSNATTPYLVEIMDVFTDPRVSEIVVQKPSQSGGSEAIANMIGRTMHLDPTDMAYVGEKEDKAKGWTQESFDAMVRVTDVLNRIVKREPEFNNQTFKGYTGGGLWIIWASSPAELSSRPFQHLFFDEKAAYKPTKEGDAVKLGEARQKTYHPHHKKVKISSPRDAEDSADIEKDYLRGDQREFYVPCPQCNEFQTLKWKNVHWPEGEPESAYMACEVNACEIEFDDLEDMLRKGRWIPAADFNGIASFKFNQLYSPFVRWSEMAKDLIEAKADKTGQKLKVWVNTCLAEPWRPKETLDYLELQLRKEPYGKRFDDSDIEVPDGVLMLTAGVDIQGDRIEMEVVGWGLGRENWSIDYQVFQGSPSFPDVWKELKEALSRDYQGTDRTFRISAAGIDSGGGNTEDVYGFVKKNAGRRWFALKGLSTVGNPLVTRGGYSKKGPRVRVWGVGTNTAKDEVFSFLRVEEQGPGCCHFPDDEERYGESYIKQLCSERRTLRSRMGQSYYIYEKIGPNVRNEALDVRVYATAARGIVFYRRDFDKWAEREAKRQIRRLQPGAPESPDPVLPKSEAGEEAETKVEADKQVEQQKPQPVRRRRVKVRNNRFSGYKV